MLTVANTATFKITDAKLYVSIVTLLAEDNAPLSKLLRDGLKRAVYGNKYKVIGNKVVEIATENGEKCIRELLDSSYQGAKDCLFLHIIIQMVMIKFLLILIKNIFFQELK